MFKTKEI